MANPQERMHTGAPMPDWSAEEWPGSSFHEPGTVRAIQQKVDLLAMHMQTQLQAHDAAMRNTYRVFETLLQDLENFSTCFREAFEERLETSQAGYPPNISACIDPDRSVGMLQVLWHAISFTTRGNTKPLALNRPGRPPLFAGRIIAVNGDFFDAQSRLQSATFPELLQQEVASLFVPADSSAPAVMQIKHLAGEELYFHQVDAPRRFLLKVVEITCGGGYFHEQ